MGASEENIVGNKSKIRPEWKRGKWRDVRNLGAARMPPAFYVGGTPGNVGSSAEKFLRDVIWPSATRGTLCYHEQLSSAGQQEAGSP